MMNKMVVSNLVHRPIRSLISMVAIALEVALILLIAGLCYGIMNDSKNRPAAAACSAATMKAAAKATPISCAGYRMSKW